MIVLLMLGYNYFDQQEILFLKHLQIKIIYMNVVLREGIRLVAVIICQYFTFFLDIEKTRKSRH